MMDQEKRLEPQQQQNRYAHLVAGGQKQAPRRAQVRATAAATKKAPPLAKPVQMATNQENLNPNPNLKPDSNSNQKQQQYYYGTSFSQVDWREQWRLLKQRLMDRAQEPQGQRRLILFIVCCALLLDNMLYMVIVPIIPDYLRSIGSWSTYTENARWIRTNASRDELVSSTSQNQEASNGLRRHHLHPQHHQDATKWVRVSGQVVYEGEDSAVGFLFASKAIVQLFVNPFSGHIIDRIGYEVPMMIGLAVMFFSTMVFACGQTYTILFLARSLQGVGSAFADTSGLAMIADRFTEEAERQRALGVALAFISFGCLVAPPFGSVLYQAAGKEVPFIILSLVCLLDGSLLLLVTPEGTFSSLWPYGSTGSTRLPVTQQQQQQDIEQSQQQTTTRAKLDRQKSISRRHSITLASAGEAPKGTPIYVLFRDPCIACCSGALVVANVSLAFLEPTISIWVQNTMPDIEEWQMGMIWLPAFVPHVLGVYSTVKLADKYPRYQWLIAAIGLVLEGLACLMVPFCSSFWSLIIPISLICFGLALIDTAILPTLGYLVDSRYVSVYGSIYAIADISYSLSYAIGPIIAGGIVEAIGFTALNLLIAIVTLGYTPILMMLRNIHDYEPFEADQSGLRKQKARELAPFGQFGRPPMAELTEEDDASSIGSTGDTSNSSAANDPREPPTKTATSKWIQQQAGVTSGGVSEPKRSVGRKMVEKNPFLASNPDRGFS